MLMPPTIQIRISSVTPHGERILKAIRDARTWVNRAQIAEAIAKRRLTPWDVAMLDYLARQGYIEARQVAKPGSVPYKWEYRYLGSYLDG